jgi:hypothetical protein
MYKYTISCYYWPAGDGRLRLRALTIKTNSESTGNGLASSHVRRLTRVDQLASSIERRRTRRLRVRCDAELVADLSLLDSGAELAAEPLIFFGQTRDLSSTGLGLVLPSTPIDENYCDESNLLKLSLHLPSGVVDLEVNPVRCFPLDESDTAMGYLMGARIISISGQVEEFERYLDSFSGQPS